MELNWLPDHEAIAAITGPIGPVITTGEARRALIEAPGLLPAAVDPHTETIIWADAGESDLREWQFLFSLSAIAKEAGGHVPTIRTHLEDLPHLEQAIGDTIPVSGFIFHMSRCGSTLLGNVLNRSPRHVAINQPGPLQDGFWTYATEHWKHPSLPAENRAKNDRDKNLFQHLVRAILRRRSDAGSKGFIKFRSWSVLFVDFIQNAFPDIPCVFMYRKPIEVLASVVQKKNVAEFATMAQKTFLAGDKKHASPDVDNLDFMTACYANYFKKALAAKPNQTAFLNYRDLRSDHLQRILREGLQMKGCISDLDLMQDEFRFYSKDRAEAKSAFSKERDLSAKTTKIQEYVLTDQLSDLARLYQQLEAAPNNLFSFAAEESVGEIEEDAPTIG